MMIANLVPEVIDYPETTPMNKIKELNKMKNNKIISRSNNSNNNNPQHNISINPRPINPRPINPRPINPMSNLNSLFSQIKLNKSKLNKVVPNQDSNVKFSKKINPNNLLIPSLSQIQDALNLIKNKNQGKNLEQTPENILNSNTSDI